MDEPVTGFVVPVHRALTEPILMGGAPRSVAIVNGLGDLGPLLAGPRVDGVEARSVERLDLLVVDDVTEERVLLGGHR